MKRDVIGSGELWLKEFVGKDNIEFVKTVDISWDKDKKVFIL